MVQIMQVKPLGWVRIWLLAWINTLAALAGFQVVPVNAEIVREGWRQIPDGHQSFDPALADHFKTLKMRNGKHINLAVSYSVVAKWNSSNKRRGQAEWTYGSDRHYADKYTDVDRKTWGQHMADLADLGLVEVSQIKGKPAYRVVPYQILNAQLSLVHAQGYGHDAQKVAHDAQGYGHDAQHITEGSITEESGNGIDLKPAAIIARAAAADLQSQTDSKKSLDEDPMPPVKVEAVVQADDIEESPTQAAKPITPLVPSHPPIDWLADDCPDAPPDDLKGFFSAAKPHELAALIERHGSERIRAHINAVRLLPNIDNPPGLVISRLRSEARPAWSWPSTSGIDDRKKYISGPYAHLIEH